MPLREITVVEELDNGETRTVKRTLSTSRFVVKIDGQRYSPEITANIEIENDGGTERTTDQCGNTERSRTSNKGWAIRVTGIVTGNDARQSNLSLQLLRDVIAQESTISITSDIISGEFEVSNTVITQSSDLVSINTPDTEGEESAFEFQLQLGQSESE